MMEYSVAGASSSYSFWIYRSFWKLVDWLYPPHCAGCGKGGIRWCADCQSKVIEIHPPYCLKCGIPTKGEKICINCSTNEPFFDAIRAYAFYQEPLRTALHRLKYHRDIALGDIFALHLIELFHHLAWDIDLITAVPLGVVRLRERGYNQASLLAYPLSLATRIPYHSKVLKRVRETDSQVKLSVQERQENVLDAFQAKSDLVAGKKVLVVDDVTTTGSTLNACAKALKVAGANQVYGLTLARTIHQIK